MYEFEKKSPEAYMRQVLALARQGEGKVSPNPMVGCIVVKDGEIIATGCHEQYGGYHAERNALLRCKEDPEGAELYVNLEPCCHYGKTPPCTEIIIEKKISKVYVGCLDPNPKVAGKGIKILQEHGILVETGILGQECRALNEVFFHYMETKLPFLAMKYAMTLDGKIAAYTGASQWITGEEARAHVQKQRSRYRAIMAGVGTVLADDPLLTCRIPGGRQPVRVICDSRLRTPLTAKIVATAKEYPTIFAVCEGTPGQEAYKAAGCRVWELPERGGHLDLTALMEKLGLEEIDSVLLEGGGTLNWTALESGLVNRVQAYIAPKLFGGKDARTPVEGQGVPLPDAAVRLKDYMLTRLGEDVLLEGEVR